MRLAGKTCIVTGGGSGFGAAIAELYAHEGADVVVADIDGAAAERAAGAIAAAGGKATSVAADVTRAADCDAMVADAVTRWGGVDILHNNVGIESRTLLVETSEEEWDRVFAVDAKSMFLATKAVVPAMERRGGGSIICVSSIAAMYSCAPSCSTTTPSLRSTFGPRERMSEISGSPSPK